MNTNTSPTPIITKCMQGKQYLVKGREKLLIMNNTHLDLSIQSSELVDRFSELLVERNPKHPSLTKLACFGNKSKDIICNAPGRSINPQTKQNQVKVMIKQAIDKQVELIRDALAIISPTLMAKDIHERETDLAIGINCLARSIITFKKHIKNMKENPNYLRARRESLVANTCAKQ